MDCRIIWSNLSSQFFTWEKVGLWLNLQVALSSMTLKVSYVHTRPIAYHSANGHLFLIELKLSWQCYLLIHTLYLSKIRQMWSIYVQDDRQLCCDIRTKYDTGETCSRSAWFRRQVHDLKVAHPLGAHICIFCIYQVCQSLNVISAENKKLL